MTAEPADGDGRGRWARWGAAAGLVVALGILGSAPAIGGAELLGYVAGAGLVSWLCYRATLWAAGAVAGLR